ncbi:M28 family metallopeptidase [Maribellus mangrovi]|uniref:M28 family metallopeptidase n=1 Tax=Maribellus mangrovi TaxID=3133146 RepID=UPI0030ED7606
MVQRKIIITIQVLISFIFSAFAQHTALQVIDTADLKEHLSFIASDELQGRRMGTEAEGLNKAADYLAENAARLGLTPGAPDYFQKVDLLATKKDETNFVEVVDAKGKSKFKAHSMVELRGPDAPKSITNMPAILVGFGEQLPDKDFDGKLVLLAQGTEKSFTNKLFHWNNRMENERLEAIKSKNPEVVLLVTDPDDKTNKIYQQLSRWYGRTRYQLASENTKEEIPVILVLPEVADQLLGGKRKYKKYLQNLVDGEQESLMEVQKRSLNLKIGKKSEVLDAKNVVAVLEGADPELKKECVVLMSHYDHLGLDENGEVYNGADDNGSGTVTIMEMAEAYANLKEKPKRSIVFLWVTGEELGMLGSNYYTQHPIVPLEKTVACFNLDMVGRVFEERDTVWNKSPKRVKDFDGIFALTNDAWPELAKINQKYCEQLDLIPDTTLPAQFLSTSDHYHFHKHSIPIVNYATGYHADYHRISDKVERINFEKMKRVAELCFLVSLEVANRDDIDIHKPEQ